MKDESVKSLPFSAFTTSKYVFYFLFLLAGLQNQSIKWGWLPMFIFYIFQFIGVFIIINFSARISSDSFKLLKMSTILSIIGCILGMLSYFNFYCLVAAALILGLSTSFQDTVYITLNLRKAATQSIPKSKTGKIISLLFVFSLAFLLIYLMATKEQNFIFILYLILFLLSYKNINTLEPHDLYRNAKVSLKSVIVSALATAIVIGARSARTLYLKNTLLILIFLILLSAALVVISINQLHKEASTDQDIHLAVILLNIATSYFLLISSFHILSQFGAKDFMLRVFLPYAVGSILSSLPYKLFLYKYKSTTVFNIYSVLLLFSLLLTNLHVYILSSFLVGMFSNHLNKKLTVYTYSKSEYSPDFRILIKVRWQMIASILTQSLVLILLILFATYNKMTHLPLFQALTTPNLGYNKQIDQLLTQVGLSFSSILVVLFLCYLFIIKLKLKNTLFGSTA